MDIGGPDPTDPVWMDHFRTPDTMVNDARTPTSTPQPQFDPGEPWSELPELKKVSPAAASGTVEALRQAGVPVLGSKMRRSGLLSGGKVDVTLSVPDRLRSQAILIVASLHPAP